MRWATAAVASGVVLVALGFWFGTSLTSGTVAGQGYGCGSAFPTSWLASGTAVGQAAEVEPTTAHERRVEAACDAAERRARTRAWASIGAGCLVGLTGWTAIREKGTPAALQRRSARV